MFRIRALASLCLSVFFSCVLASGQVTTGQVSGTVSDSTGAVIPGARVTLRNVETGITRTVQTDAQGVYRAPQLSLGMYEISAESAGFQTLVRSGIEMTVGRQAVVDFAMQIGAVAERITVTGEAPLLETTNATVANLVTEAQMRELPLSGRSFTDLAAIQPGVVTDLGIPSGVFQGGGRMAIGGARPQQSLYLLDGLDIASPYSNVAPVSVMNQTLGVDTIREFTVIQSNYGAQYGRAIGGIVNAVTRSGTNEIHGSLFEFFRNEKLDAKNYFDAADEPIPAFKRNQFGGTLGGPIVKDNAFYFFSYEGLQQVFGTTDAFGIVLSDETRLGRITGCPPGMTKCTKEQRIITKTVTVNPDIVPIINLIPRAPAGQLYRNDGIQEYNGTRKQPGRENYYMFRIDQRLSDNDSLFGRWTGDYSSKELPDAQFLPNVSGPTTTHTSTDDDGFYGYLSLEWTRIMSPSVLNVARAGFARNNNRQCMCIEGTDKNAEEFPGLPPQLTVIPGQPFGGPWGIPGVGIPGGHNGPGNTTNGADLDDPLVFIDNTFTFADSVRITKGNHSMDIGGDVRRYQQNAMLTVWGHGNTSFQTPMENFLTAGRAPYCGTPGTGNCRGINTITATVSTNAAGQIGPPDAYRGWRQTYGAFHFQDDYQLLSNLTLNFGLRWERVTAPIEVNGKVANIIDLMKDTGWTQLGDQPFFKLRDGWKGFAPRFGFAYSPDGNTSVRGGFGVFKEIPLEYQWQLGLFYPPDADRLVYRARPWPNPLAGVTATNVTAARQPSAPTYDSKYPYAYQWNLGLERQIRQSWVAKASYIGTRGVSLVTIINPWQPVLSTDSQGVQFTRSGAPSVNPAFDSARLYANMGDSYYNSMQLRLQKRMTQGFEFSVSYTWSKNLSNVGIGLKGAEVGGGSSFQVGNIWDFKSYDKGRAAQDSPHNFTFNYTYELPIGPGKAFGSNMGGVGKAILSGWQINGIASARSGLPMTIGGPGYTSTGTCRTCEIRPFLKPGGDNNPVIGDVNKWFDVTQFIPVRSGYFGNVGRNTLSAPKLLKFDFSLFKSFEVGEGRNLQFRAEFFNLPNHPNFGRPDSSVFQSTASAQFYGTGPLAGTTTGQINPNAGIISETVGGSRIVQLGLKFEF